MARNVVVTGGGTGIGRAVAAAFAADGDTVVIIGRRSEPRHTTAAELGPGVRAVVCDGTDPSQVGALRVELPAWVDVLVNCAGGNTNLDANLISAVLMTTVVQDRLTTGGTVISIGSIAADKGAGAYGVAKAGLASWNVGLAAELGPRSATANVVAPGYIRSCRAGPSPVRVGGGVNLTHGCRRRRHRPAVPRSRVTGAERAECEPPATTPGAHRRTRWS
ncbi:MAG: SDR family NAD(P)-dependent oxidoreductase [Pseudonocardiaceae bacterium]